MAEFSWSSGLIGGVLIGLSATLLLLANGRIAGISGIFNGAIFNLSGDAQWRWLFIGGLLIGTLIYEYGLATKPTPQGALAPISMIIGGLIVGFGTRMGNGCTSGHGVCGLGRLSQRSLAAVITFLATAFITVYIVRHVLMF
ncbi:MAG: YeeE/YedE family protein [Caldilineaceae bacterium]|nr:YeeE/YedE family protein [Caldilineaceae bacterium]MCB0095807.1 YeeE/YedE family protein [Caldilineaceae bacterium]MCB0140720.1 YeeE/YedE family protein [Caldilineaceae bacterium]